MSFFTSIQNFFVTTEADVLSVITKIKKAEQVAEHEIGLALNWIADNAPQIAADIEQVLSIVQIVGLGNPTVGVAVTAANEAVAALNAFAAAQKSGSGNVAAVISGYSAFKSAQGAVASAASVAVAAPPKAAA